MCIRDRAQIVFLPMEGIAQGSQPIISFNYGARQKERVIEAIKMVIKVALTFSVIMVTLMELFPALFVSMFTNDLELMELGVKMLRVYIFGYIIIGANSSFQQIYRCV